MALKQVRSKIGNGKLPNLEHSERHTAMRKLIPSLWIAALAARNSPASASHSGGRIYSTVPRCRNVKPR
jgi:hypothetical protein